MGVFYRKNLVVDEAGLAGVESYEQLVQILENMTGVSQENIKLISNGKVLSAMNYSMDCLSSKIVMMGSSFHPETPPEQFIRVKDDLTSEGINLLESRAARDEQSDRRLRAKRKFANPYRFHELETLSGFEDEPHARSILESLASDPGIIAVLKKHKWSVGKLCEMYPEGYVGVSDVCVLGLNKNKGQEIYLRLRTDDLKGFRKILTIKKVLYHELAHNEHSDHDDNFYILMRQIEREVVELDWRQSTKGYKLGYATDTQSEAFGDVNNSAEKTIDKLISEKCEEEKISSEPCRNESLVLNDPPSSPAAFEKPCMSPSENNESFSTSAILIPEDYSMPRRTTCFDDNNLKNGNDNSVTVVDGSQLMASVSRCIIAKMDETLVSFYAMQQEPPERIILLRQAMEDMLQAMERQERFQQEASNLSLDQLLETLNLVKDILVKAMDPMKPQYRSLNQTKKKFQRVLRESNAVPILFAAGFAVKDSDHLFLERYDPAMLHMFVDILNSAIDVSKSALLNFIE